MGAEKSEGKCKNLRDSQLINLSSFYDREHKKEERGLILPRQGDLPCYFLAAHQCPHCFTA
jgi:hypothetical protein